MNRIMTIFPSAYFPPISYVQFYICSEQAHIERFEHFIKQSIRTRCEILGPNGKQILSIPVDRIHGNKTKMGEVRIIENDWRKIHCKSIQTAYSSAPFYDYYSLEINELIHYKTELLVDFNRVIFQRILEWLDISYPLVFTQQYDTNPTFDYRNTLFDSQSTQIQPAYTQVFRQKKEYLPNLSLLDLILNEGPMARKWIQSDF